MHDDGIGTDTDDESEVELAAARHTLRTLLTAAGFEHRPGPGRRDVTFRRRCGERVVRARLNADWLHVATDIGALPAEPVRRSKLLLWVARANARMASLKYSVTGRDVLILETYVPAALVTADDVRRSILCVNDVAERDARAPSGALE